MNHLKSSLAIIVLIIMTSIAVAQDTPSIAFLEVSPDGNYVAGVGNIVIRIWDTTTGELVKEIPQEKFVSALSWSPDSSRLATLTSNIVRVWNITGNDPIGTLSGEFDPDSHKSILVQSVGWSPDGQLLAVGGDAMQPRMQLWDANTYQFVTELPWMMDISNILWNPDSQKNIFAVYLDYDYSSVTLISPDPNQQYMETCLDCPIGTLRDVRWNPSGTMLAIADNQGQIFLVDVENQQLILTIQSPTYISMLAWSPDGTMIATTTSTDGYTWEIQLWDTNTGELLGIVPGSHVIGFNPHNQDLIYVNREDRTEIKFIAIADILFDPDAPPQILHFDGERIYCMGYTPCLTFEWIAINADSVTLQSGYFDDDGMFHAGGWSNQTDLPSQGTGGFIPKINNYAAQLCITDTNICAVINPQFE